MPAKATIDEAGTITTGRSAAVTISAPTNEPARRLVRDAPFLFVGVTVATLVVGEPFSISLVLGGAVALVGVYLGAFASRPHRTSATSAPECLRWTPVPRCPASTAARGARA